MAVPFICMLQSYHSSLLTDLYIICMNPLNDMLKTIEADLADLDLDDLAGV